MIELASTEFRIDVPSLSQERLSAFATGLFEAWEMWLEDGLSLTDYAVRLEVAQGSFKGAGTVAALAAILYGGIGNYGSFREGVRQIHQDLKRASDFLTEHAIAPFSAQGRPGLKTRFEQGKVTQLEALFRRVERGQLAPVKAAEAALALFRNEPDVTPEFLGELEASMVAMPRIPHQLEMPGVASPPEPTEPPRRRRGTSIPQAPTAVVPHVEVAIWRESKRGPRRVTVLLR